MTTTEQDVQPLDFTSYEVQAEHPDVTALKAQVRQVATKYAQRHNWCREVNRALREMGIESDPSSAKIAPVKITTTLGPTFTIRVDPAPYVGKTLAEQMSALAAAISPITLNVPGHGTSNLTVTPEMIASVEVTPKAAEATQDDDYVWRYVSSEGRVLHAYDAVTYRMTTGYNMVASACRRVDTYASYITEHSTRGTGNRCVSCEKRVGV